MTTCTMTHRSSPETETSLTLDQTCVSEGQTGAEQEANEIVSLHCRGQIRLIIIVGDN